MSWTPLCSVGKTTSILVLLEGELADTKEGSSRVYLSTRLTGRNGLGSQPLSTLKRNSCQVGEQEQDAMTDITNGRVRTIPHRPYTVCYSSLKESKKLAVTLNPLYLLRHGHLGTLFAVRRTLKLSLLD